MGLTSNPLFGTPKESAEQKQDREVVKAPEFDITQYAKKLGVSIGVLLGAAIAALKLAGVEEVTDPAVLVGALAVAGAGLLGMSFVMAVDIASRAYLSGEGSATKKEEVASDEGPSQIVSLPPGTVAWLQGEGGPHPVLALAGGKDTVSYLVAAGQTVEPGPAGQGHKAIDNAPKWVTAEKVEALKPSKWKP